MATLPVLVPVCGHESGRRSPLFPPRGVGGERCVYLRSVFNNNNDYLSIKNILDKNSILNKMREVLVGA